MPVTVALVVQHTATEHAGVFAGWWTAAGLRLDVRHVYDGDDLLASLESFDALIVLGGPQSVVGGPGEVSEAEFSLMREAVSSRVPTLGICLGAQLLAAACGGQVQRGAIGEHGVGEVTFSPSVADDELLGSLGAGPREVIQWHGDGVTALPREAVNLASSELYPSQAFRVGTRAWGLQFHAEATVEMVGHWSVSDPTDAFDALMTLKSVDDLQPVLEAAWRPVVEAFAGLARERSAERAGSLIGGTGQ